MQELLVRTRSHQHAREEQTGSVWAAAHGDWHTTRQATAENQRFPRFESFPRDTAKKVTISPSWIHLYLLLSPLVAIIIIVVFGVSLSSLQHHCCSDTCGYVSIDYDRRLIKPNNIRGGAEKIQLHLHLGSKNILTFRLWKHELFKYHNSIRKEAVSVDRHMISIEEEDTRSRNRMSRTGVGLWLVPSLTGTRNLFVLCTTDYRMTIITLIRRYTNLNNISQRPWKASYHGHTNVSCKYCQRGCVC